MGLRGVDRNVPVDPHPKMGLFLAKNCVFGQKKHARAEAVLQHLVVPGEKTFLLAHAPDPDPRFLVPAAALLSP